VRWVAVVASLLLLVAGVWDLGRRADAERLVVSECIREPPSCAGRVVAAPYHHVSSVRPDGVVVLGRSDSDLIVRGVEPGALAGMGILSRVSVAGVWHPPNVIVADRVMLHRVRRLKLLAGLAGLALWLGLVARFAWGRRG